MSKKKAVPPRVRPHIKKPRTTNADLVATTSSTVAAMQASASWSAATDVQREVAVWSTSANDVAANTATIAKLKDQLHTAVAQQRTLRVKWSVSLKQVLAAVDAFCADSAALIEGFGLVAVSTTAHALLDVPSNLATSPGPLPGEARLTWTRGLAIHGFLVQFGTDTGNATTWSSYIPCSRTKFTMLPQAALPSGSHVFFRVAAIDPHAPSGQSPWSAWVAGTVR